MGRAFLCDFDGTVAPADVGNAFFAHFAAARRKDWEAIVAGWLAGDLGSRECLRRECALVRVTLDEALAFTRRFALDSGFAPFVREAEARGDRVMVVSEGLDFYVRDALSRAGLAHLPWAANRARFRGGALQVEFPFADRSCGACGNCKAQYVRRYRAQGCTVVMVGNGLSDRCGARAADVVLARGELLEFCRREGMSVQPFADFADVRERALSAV